LGAKFLLFSDLRSHRTGFIVVHVCNPAFGRLRWEECEFKASLGCILRKHLPHPQQQQRNKDRESALSGRFLR
jgi:hypothetical protein